MAQQWLHNFSALANTFLFINFEDTVSITIFMSIDIITGHLVSNFMCQIPEPF